MKILIVDDAPPIRQMLAAILKSLPDVELLFAEDGTSAIQLLRVGSSTPNRSIDLILLDLHMPEVSGVDVCIQVKNDEALKDIPIVMITSSGDEDDLGAAFDAGVMDYINKPFSRTELLARVTSLLSLKREMDARKSLVVSLADANSNLEQANSRLEFLSTHDALTGLSNRRHFENFYEMEWRRCHRSGSQITVIMIDVDNFKKFNDHYGHQAGDKCLKNVADVMMKYTKRPGDLAARYGGEEFILILSETSIEVAAKIAEQVRQGIEQLGITHKPASSVVTVSIGIATTIPENSEMAKLIVRADSALYRAKDGGRNKVEHD